MDEKLVDILLATYNTNIDFLKQQLDSILGQTHKNIRLYISDDASNKKDVKSCLDEYKNKDERITVFYQENNLGVNKNFEFLLKNSTADYIMFSDHDDIWYENKVEESLNKLIEDDVDLVYTDARQIDEKGKVLHESYLKYKSMPKIKGNSNIITFSRHIAIGCSQIFTKAVKEGMLPFKKVMAHDWISMFIANNLKGVSYIDKPLFDYRLHNSNVFGGRSMKQNISNWKEKNGKNFASYKKYRKKAIQEAYLDGCLMCFEYIKTDEEKKIIEYYNEVLKTNIINLKIHNYFKYLYSRAIGRRMLKEITLFHFPLVGLVVFLVI